LVQLSRVALSFCAHQLDAFILDDHPYIQITVDISGAATYRAKEPGRDNTLICLERLLGLLEESLVLSTTNLQKVIG
jgi:hypothetical protein